MQRTIRIEDLLTRLGLTQAQLAEKAGVTTMTVWRWKKYGLPEHGPARALLERMAEESAS
jgi:transcriptional regulator with XRE-family HTH domain